MKTRFGKTIALLLALLLAFSTVLAGCGKKDGAQNSSNNTQNELTDNDNTGNGNTDNGNTGNDNTSTDNADTIGAAYVNAFNEIDSTDPNEIVNALIDKEIVDYSFGQMDVEPGFLDGFDADITGFNTGVKFSPMIGSIPFVGYVLETDDTDALVDELNINANPRWNICTEADETVMAVKGNLVFFMMCQNDEE